MGKVFGKTGWREGDRSEGKRKGIGGKGFGGTEWWRRPKGGGSLASISVSQPSEVYQGKLFPKVLNGFPRRSDKHSLTMHRVMVSLLDECSFIQFRFPLFQELLSKFIYPADELLMLLYSSIFMANTERI